MPARRRYIRRHFFGFEVSVSILHYNISDDAQVRLGTRKKKQTHASVFDFALNLALLIGLLLIAIQAEQDTQSTSTAIELRLTQVSNKCSALHEPGCALATMQGHV